jgi:hypothetical protein
MFITTRNILVYSYPAENNIRDLGNIIGSGVGTSRGSSYSTDRNTVKACISEYRPSDWKF